MVFAGLLLVGGSFTDRFGRKRFFLFGLIIFASGSIGAAVSGSVALLITWRAVMGLGAALHDSASLSIVNDVFRDPSERARAIGAWGATIGLGIAIGPIAGGLLLSRFWWGSIFLVNVPVVIAGVLGALFLVPDSKKPRRGASGSCRSRSVDRRLRSPAAGQSSKTDNGWTSGAFSVSWPPASWSSAHSLDGRLTALTRCSSSVFLESPVLNRRARRNTRDIWTPRRVVCPNAVPTVRPGLFAAAGPDYACLPIAATLVLVAVFSPFFVRLIGVKFTVAAGLASIAGGLWQVSTVSTVTTTYGQVVPGLLLLGLGAGLLLPTATNSVVGSLPQGDSGLVSASKCRGTPGWWRARRRRDRKHTGDALIRVGSPRRSTAIPFH